MVIKRSSAREVSCLLQDLEQGLEADREAAAARLAVIGTRAVSGLLALVESAATPGPRAAALAVLEAIGDPRAEEPAFDWLERGDAETASAAAALLRRLLDSPRGMQVLDRLAAIALDISRPDTLRIAALDALRDMPASLTAPIRERLGADASETVRAAVAGSAALPASAPDPADVLGRAAEGDLREDPATLRGAVLEAAALAPLPTLHRLIGVLREKEGSPEIPEARRREWMAVRAAVHLALAHRGSTVALYDLRETVERASEGPVELLAALETIGDATCLESIAAAHARLADGPGGKGWWREHLVAAFRAIVQRERLTERHAVLRRLKTRWPESAAALLAPPA